MKSKSDILSPAEPPPAEPPPAEPPPLQAKMISEKYQDFNSDVPVCCLRHSIPGVHSIYFLIHSFLSSKDINDESWGVLLRFPWGALPTDRPPDLIDNNKPKYGEHVYPNESRDGTLNGLELWGANKFISPNGDDFLLEKTSYALDSNRNADQSELPIKSPIESQISISDRLNWIDQSNVFTSSNGDTLLIERTTSKIDSSLDFNLLIKNHRIGALISVQLHLFASHGTVQQNTTYGISPFDMSNKSFPSLLRYHISSWGATSVYLSKWIDRVIYRVPHWMNQIYRIAFANQIPLRYIKSDPSNRKEAQSESHIESPIGSQKSASDRLNWIDQSIVFTSSNRDTLLLAREISALGLCNEN